MKHMTLHLKDEFPFLGEGGQDPFVETYFPDNLTEMGWDDRCHPCLIICPGGGYSFCSQREAEPIALQFLAEGFHVFVLNYSTAPHRFPNQLRQVAAVMELIFENASKWHCDTEHVALMGFSAGGHLAAHYANAYDIPEVREVFPDSKGVQASILCYPVITACPEQGHMGSFENLLGHMPLTDEEQQRFSCQNLVSERTPPTFLWHTAPDETVPVANSLLYAQALTENIIPVEMHIFPFGGHGLATATEQTVGELEPNVSRNAVWMEYARNWLNMTFDRK